MTNNPIQAINSIQQHIMPNIPIPMEVPKKLEAKTSSLERRKLSAGESSGSKSGNIQIPYNFDYRF